jgi:hypothetical protein
MKNYLKALLFSVGIVVVLVLLALAMVVGFTADAHGATTSSVKHSNGLGFVMYQDNPNQYLMGYVSKADVAQTRADRKVVVLEIRPTNTYSMFSQSLAFCNASEEQMNKLADASVVVFTYSKFMHHADCFDLYRVDKVGK